MRSPILLASLLLFASLAASLTLEAPGEVRTCACEPFAYTAELSQGRTPAPAETFDLSLLASSPLFTGYAPPRLTLASGERADVSVQATAACTLPTGDYLFRLTAEGRSGATAQALTTVRVEECSLVQARLEEAVPACACGTGRYELVLVNRGSAASEVSLATDLPGATLADDRLVLAAGQEARVSLFVNVPCGVPQPVPFEVQVESRRGLERLVSVMSPAACAPAGLNQTPASTPVPTNEPDTLVANVTVTQAGGPGGLTGLFTGAASAGPYLLAVAAVLALLWYVMKDREFYNPFAKPSPAPVPAAARPAEAPTAAPAEPTEERLPLGHLDAIVQAIQSEGRKRRHKGRSRKR